MEGMSVLCPGLINLRDGGRGLAEQIRTVGFCLEFG